MPKKHKSTSGMASLFQNDLWFLDIKTPPLKPIEQIEKGMAEYKREIEERKAVAWQDRTTTGQYPIAEIVRNLRLVGKQVLKLAFDEKRIAMSEVLYKRKLETRLIYPSNQWRYMADNGEPIIYDYLWLVSDKHQAVVQVDQAKGAQIYDLVDDNDRQIWETDKNGRRFCKRSIEYPLGEVVKFESLTK